MSTGQARPRNRQAFEAAAPGFSEEAREAVTGAFDALTDWREEMTNLYERHGTAVFRKMTDAAKAMGWPSEFVDATRLQIESSSKLQMDMVDQVMKVWEQQLKSPGSQFGVPNGMLEKWQEMAGGAANNPFQAWFDAAGKAQFPGMPDMGSVPANPMQFWLSAAEAWQRNWANALSAWSDAATRGKR